MAGDWRGQKVGTANSLGWLVAFAPLRRFVDRFAVANQEQQHWISGLRIKRTADPVVKSDMDSKARHSSER